MKEKPFDSLIDDEESTAAPFIIVTKPTLRTQPINNSSPLPERDIDFLTPNRAPKFTPGWRCGICGIDESKISVKRKGPDGLKSICNVCYLRGRKLADNNSRGSARPRSASPRMLSCRTARHSPYLPERSLSPGLDPSDLEFLSFAHFEQSLFMDPSLSSIFASPDISPESDISAHSPLLRPNSPMVLQQPGLTFRGSVSLPIYADSAFSLGSLDLGPPLQTSQQTGNAFIFPEQGEGMLSGELSFESDLDLLSSTFEVPNSKSDFDPSMRNPKVSDTFLHSPVRPSLRPFQGQNNPWTFPPSPHSPFDQMAPNDVEIQSPHYSNWTQR